MRKLTLMATTAIAAMALMAAAAAPAQADREFLMIDLATGDPCSPCYDTGYAGEIGIKNWLGQPIGTCDVRFTAVILSSGLIETDDTVVDSCSSTVADVSSCDDSWPGQIRLPDTGGARVDLEMCLDGTTEVTHDITFAVTNNPRAWTQITEDLTTPYRVAGSQFVDDYSADNAGLEIQ